MKIDHIITDLSISSKFNITINNCHFTKINGGSQNGGAIGFNNNIRLFISYCFFTNITTNGEGGAIYTSIGLSEIKFCCFYFTYSTYLIDQYGGNIFKTTCEISNLELCSALQCWYTTTSATDSIYHVNNALSSIKYFNGTLNYGKLGSVGGRFYNNNFLSNISFFTIVSSVDYTVFEIWKNPINLHYMNIINNTGLTHFLMMTIETTHFNLYDSYIFGNSHSTSSNQLSGTIYFYNCFTDFKYILSGIITTSISITLKNFTIQNHICVEQNLLTKNFKGKSYSSFYWKLPFTIIITNL